MCDVPCDLAHSCSQCPRVHTEPTFPSTRASLTIHGQHYRTRLSQSHPHTEDTAALRIHIMSSEDWDAHIFDLIHWDSIQRSMARITGDRRKSAIKLMFKLWATNQVLSTRTRNQQTRHDHRCIRCCQLHEDFDHIFLCKGSRAILQDAETTLRKHLQTYNLASPMIQCMLAGIRTWTHSAPHYDFTQHPTDDFLLSVQTAYHHQTIIGWSNFLQGRLATSWLLSHDLYHHLRHLDHQYCSDLLGPSLIETLWAFSQSVWNDQNQIVHGATRVEAHKIQTQRINTRIQQAYAHQTDLSHADSPIIFSRPLNHRLQQPLNTKVHWYLLYHHILNAPSAPTAPIPPSRELHSFFRPFAHLLHHPLPPSSPLPHSSIASTGVAPSSTLPQSHSSHNSH